MSITVKVEGAAELLSSLTQVQRGLVDFNDLGCWDMVISRFREVERQHFAAAGGAGQSGAFAPLSHPYREVKVKKYGDVPILTASGKLMRSLTSATADSVVVKEKQQLTLGTSLKYAKFHQSGTGRMPARKPIDPTDAQKQYMVEPIKIKLKQLIANAKLRDARGF